MAAGVVLALSATTNSWAEAFIEFDREVLGARGLDPKVAEYFRASPRFSAGKQRVVLQVNGSPAGQVLATFDDEGQLCLDAALFEHAAIAAPRTLPSSADPTQCVRVIEGPTQMQVRLDPGQQQVGLLVPTDWLLERSGPPRTWTSGGVAGVLNYNGLAVASSGAGYSSHYRHLDAELGFNAGDWVVRSRHSYTQSDSEVRFENLYTNASRTWERFQANVQLGQLTLSSTLFAGGAFTGVQVLPETALGSHGEGHLGTGTVVEGLAYAPSRVEVRQGGVLVHTALVPGGAFALRNLPLLSVQQDVEVSVIEDGAQPRRFRVPASSLLPASIHASPGFSLAAGQVRRFTSSKSKEPRFLAASKDWRWGHATQFTAGWTGAEGYQSLGFGVQQALTRDSTISVRHLGAHAAGVGAGQSLQATLNTAFGPQFSAGLSAAQRTSRFLTLNDLGLQAPYDNLYDRAERQWGASLSYSDQYWGALNGTIHRYRIAGGQAASRMSVGWSRLFDNSNFSLNLEREKGNNSRGTGLYATLSVPLGQRRTLSTFVREDARQGTRSGARYSEQVSETTSYSLAVERADSGQADLHARLNLLPRYTSLDLGHSRNSMGARSYDVALRGGLALHEGGVTPSPYELTDTFGLIEIGSSAGTKVATPRGPVWTDPAGRAVAASLLAYNTSRLEVDPLSLGGNVDLLNGIEEIDAGRGAVPRIKFTLNTARRLMLHVRTDAGAWVPKGGAVYGSGGEFLTTVVDAGLIYLADAPQPLVLQVALPDNRRCVVDIDLLPVTDNAWPYQVVEATCAITTVDDSPRRHSPLSAQRG